MKRITTWLAAMSPRRLRSCQQSLKLLDSLLDLDFSPLRYNGDPKDVYNFAQTSMFYSNDPVIILENYLHRISNAHFGNAFVQNLLGLVESEPAETCVLPLTAFSGLMSAKEPTDWPNLIDYGNSLIPRCQWNSSQSHFYGFDTDLDYENLKIQIEKNISSGWFLAWNGRYYFANNGVSHRLAAYCRQDREQGRNGSIRIAIHRRKINQQINDKVFGKYLCVFLSDETYKELYKLLEDNQFTLPFFDFSTEQVKILWIERNGSDKFSFLLKFLKKINRNFCYILENAT